MSHEQHERETEGLLDSAPAPQARAEFRANLRQRFLFGAASAPQVDVLPDERPRAANPGRSRSWKPWIVLAAAAGVAALLWSTKPAPHHWQLLPGSNATVVRINGTPLPAGEMEQIGTSLNDARSVSAEGGSLRLAYRDQYALEIPDGARVDFASFGNTGGVDPYSFSAQGAALRIVTGPGFHGHELHLRSGVASLHVTGTAFAVDDCPDGVCICGVEGRVALQQKGGQELPLEHGKQCWFPKDGSPLTWGEAHEAHVAPVRELEAAARGSWRP